MAQVIIKKFSPKTHKIKAVIYGGSGSWKTSFGGTAPKPIFASAEGGLLSIAHLNPDYVEIKSIEDLAGLLSYLKTQPHEYETIVIDSITEISEIIKRGIEKKSGRAMQIQDFGTLSKKIREILAGFRDLNMHVLFIAQEKYEKDGDTVIKIAPSLNGKSAEEIAYFMDVVGYLTIDRASNERRIITTTDSKYSTKDRTRMIGNDTTPDFGAWVEAVKGLQVVKEDETVYDQNLDASWVIEEETPEIKTQKAPTTTTPPPQARRAPEKDASDAQKKLLSSLIGELTASIANDGDKLLKVVAKTILQITNVDVGIDNGTVEEMLGKLKSSHASTLIEYLKTRLANAKKAKEAEANAQGEADQAQAEAEWEAQAQAQAQAEAEAEHDAQIDAEAQGQAEAEAAWQAEAEAQAQGE